jgi:hypothetical protein
MLDRPYLVIPPILNYHSCIFQYLLFLYLVLIHFNQNYESSYKKYSFINRLLLTQFTIHLNSLLNNLYLLSIYFNYFHSIFLFCFYIYSLSLLIFNCYYHQKSIDILTLHYNYYPNYCVLLFLLFISILFLISNLMFHYNFLSIIYIIII